MSLANKVQSKRVKPFVKWVGGKNQVVPQLAKFIPEEFDDYYEPFLGGGALYFYLSKSLPGSSQLNDINEILIFAFLTVKKNPNLLISQLKNLEHEYHKLDDVGQKQYFYQAREEFNNINSQTIRKVALLIFLNKTCFNGLYRENSKGKFNVPFGNYNNPKICDDENLREVSRLLKKATLTSIDYVEAVKTAIKDDFIYFDPPYHPLNKTSNFTSYSKDSFNEIDQRRLRDLFVELDSRGCKLMLSNSSSPFIVELYAGFRQEPIMAPRSINSNGNARGKIQELVILNY